MQESMLSFESELNQNNNDATEKVKGSGWSLYTYDKLYSMLQTLKVARTGSYIKTENSITLVVDYSILKTKTMSGLTIVRVTTKLSKQYMLTY